MTSEYMQSFQMAIEPNPQTCLARKLKAPLLDYGMNQTHRPENGKWNFKGCKVYEPAKILGWPGMPLIAWFLEQLKWVGKDVVYDSMLMPRIQASIWMKTLRLCFFQAIRHLDVAQHLRTAGHSVIKQYQIQAPTLFVVVLPQSSSDLYQAVKQPRSFSRATILGQRLSERDTPKAFKLKWVGAIASYVVHPPPGAHGLPSFSGVVGSLDSGLVGTSLAFSGKNNILSCRYHSIELPAIQGVYPKGNSPMISTKDASAACKRHNIQTKVTVVLVDSTGNCLAGTVVDSILRNFNFICKATAVPQELRVPLVIGVQCGVIFDQNNFNQDSIQGLTYALCHISARTTRSLSVPAPLRYAEAVASRARHHFDPSFDFYNFNQVDNRTQLYHESFHSIHTSMRHRMYDLIFKNLIDATRAVVRAWLSYDSPGFRDSCAWNETLLS
ncbi:Piwi domain-containing protein [Rhizoctonia solani AG-1 IA]|uniref:Piwi domain-containing protein n=1 Tax=Thanatephorus cucumeris (strain AG1-IA) TaxID=983506 RepID=L8WRY9_THACA|nr:Piwi domain-containing protein [Rhizoctonia solani AG-1 IA]